MAIQHREPRPRPLIHCDRFQPCKTCEGRGIICREYHGIVGQSSRGYLVRSYYPNSTACERCDACNGQGRVKR